MSSTKVSNFARGWQNRARHEMLKDDALFRADDISLEELGMITCGRLHSENEYFKTIPSYTNEIDNLYQVMVEGVDKRLIYHNVGTWLHVWNSLSGASRTVSSDIISGNHISYAPLRPTLSDYTHVYITDGTTMLADTGTETMTWGIDPPTSSPSVETGSGSGNLSAGDYVYVYTFYDQSTGSESDPSNASSTITASADDSHLITNIGISSSSRVTSRRLYRTLADGGSYYLVATIPDNTTLSFVDTISDNDLTTEANTDQGIPPVGDFVVEFKGRLFLCGDTNFPERAYFSRKDRPENWPSTYYVEVEFGRRVRSLKVFDGNLYLFMEDGIERLSGTTADTFEPHSTRAHMGLAARWSAATGPDGIYYLSHDGIYRFDGAKSVRISDPIGRTFGLDADTWIDIVDMDSVEETCRAGFNRGVYYILVPMKDSDDTATNRLLAYNALDETWVRYTTDCKDLFCDRRRDEILGVVADYDNSNYYTVYNLLDSSSSTVSTASPEFITKSFRLTRSTEYAITGSGLKGREEQHITWVRQFRLDADGDWDLEFYIDGRQVHTQSFSDLSESSKMSWYDFPSKLKGLHMYVRGQATGTPKPTTHKFRSIEIK